MSAGALARAALTAGGAETSNNSAHGCLFNIFVVLIPALQRDLVQPGITAEGASRQYLTILRDDV